MKTIDTHCHLDNKDLKLDKDMIVINIGTDEQSLIDNKNIWNNEPNIFNTVGIHPCDISYFLDNDPTKIKEYITPKTVAVGEIGLDYFHTPFSKEEQQKYFIEQIKIANDLSLPVVIHTRESLGDTYDIICNFPDTKFLLHSWSGDNEMTLKYISLGSNIYFSYNGILTFKNAPIQKESIKHIPLDKLMFETDSPYLSPEPFRGQKNEPKRVVEVIKYAATILGKTYNEMNESNNRVSMDFFGLNGDIFNES